MRLTNWLWRWMELYTIRPRRFGMVRYDGLAMRVLVALIPFNVLLRALWLAYLWLAYPLRRFSWIEYRADALLRDGWRRKGSEAARAGQWESGA